MRKGRVKYFLVIAISLLLLSVPAYRGNTDLSEIDLLDLLPADPNLESNDHLDVQGHESDTSSSIISSLELGVNRSELSYQLPSQIPSFDQTFIPRC